jgi:hypothetical protein
MIRYNQKGLMWFYLMMIYPFEMAFMPENGQFPVSGINVLPICLF